MQEGYIDAVGGHQHWPQTGDSESVGGAVADIQNLRKRKGLIGGWGGGGGGKRDAWWHQEVTNTQFRETLESILQEDKRRRNFERYTQ